MPVTRILAISDVRIRDLAIDLSQGQHRDVDYGVARASKDLKKALSEGRVRTRRVETRPMTSKQKPDGRIPALGVLLHAPQGSRMGAAPPQIPKTQVPTSAPAPSSPATEQALGTIADMVKSLQVQVRALKERDHLVPEDILRRIQDTIKEAIPRTMVQEPGTAPPRQVTPEEPVFVPKDLGKVEGEARVSFKESESEDAGIREAVNSLKKMRRK